MFSEKGYSVKICLLLCRSTDSLLTNALLKCAYVSDYFIFRLHLLTFIGLEFTLVSAVLADYFADHKHS